MFRLKSQQSMHVATNNNKHTIINEIVYMRQLLFFLLLTLLLLSDASVVFNIWSSHPNTKLPNRRFLHKYSLISKYSSILHLFLY